MMHEIILLLCYILLWALVMLRAYGYRRLGLMTEEAKLKPDFPASQLPPLSVIVTAQEQSEELRANLPHILEQEYPAPFEVIVVDMNSSDDTRLLLESMQDRYPHLHIIVNPPSALNISPTQLALTLGFRSANHDWVVLTQAHCFPSSSHWLAKLGRECNAVPETQIVLGLTRFHGCRGWNGLRLRFFHIWQQMLHLPYAQRFGAYRSEPANLCYRRSLFLEHRGFAEHTDLLAGSIDIMVNHHSNARNTRICLHPDAFVFQRAPHYARWWHQERLFFMETRRHFRRRHLYRFIYFRHVLQTLLFTLSTLSLVLFSLWLSCYWLLGVVVLLWLVHAYYRNRWFSFTARALSERSFTFSLPLLLHLVPLWDLSARIRWTFTNKKIFQKKYLSTHEAQRTM